MADLDSKKVKWIFHYRNKAVHVWEFFIRGKDFVFWKSNKITIYGIKYLSW